MLQKSALKILEIVNRDKDHIPSDTNHFPYEIVLNPKMDRWTERLPFY